MKDRISDRAQSILSAWVQSVLLGLPLEISNSGTLQHRLHCNTPAINSFAVSFSIIIMTTTIKISPIPQNLTEEQIRNQLGRENISRVIIIDGSAYVTLPDSSVLERLAGKYGDNLRINDWSATIQPLDGSFDIASLRPEQVTYEKTSQLAGDGLRRPQNLIGGVVQGVKDMIGSGISQQLGPTVNFKEYNEKLGKVVNIILAIWLICLLS